MIKHPQPPLSASGDPLIIGHLMASAPPKSRKANAGSVALSILGHGALLALALYITSLPASSSGPGPRFTDIVLPPDPVPEPTLPPPPPVSTGAGAAASAGPGGFPTLDAPPMMPPTVLPPIRLGAFTKDPGEAMGEPGGTPGGTGTRHVTGDDVSAAPVFVLFTVAPELKNRNAVERALVRAYPPMLRDAGMTGHVLVWVLIDESGQVLKVLVKESSGLPGLDEAALGVARIMRFSPGLNRDKAVKVWVAVPVEFRLDR